MNVVKNKLLTVKELSFLVHRSVKSLQRSILVKYKSTGVIAFKGVGTFSIMKRGKQYRFIKVMNKKQSESERDIVKELIEALEGLKPYFCDKCNENLDKVISNASK